MKRIWRVDEKAEDLINKLGSKENAVKLCDEVIEILKDLEDSSFDMMIRFWQLIREKLIK